MYHVIGTGFTAVLLYIISYFFYRIKFFSFSNFIKNYGTRFLLQPFLMTAVAGLFLAMQITYKWDLPFVKTVLKWHVESGIGLAFTGIFHFIWHLSYFGKIFDKQESLIKTGEILILTPSEIGRNPVYHRLCQLISSTSASS